MKRALVLAALSLIAAGVAAQPGAGPSLDIGEGQEALRITSPTGEVRWDEERNLVYGSDRVIITYMERRLEADAIVFDPLTREAQAFGNVILEGPEEHFEADTIWYNFTSEEGVAQNVRGWDSDLYLQGPEFRRLSAEEILFRRAPANWDRLDTEEPVYETPLYTTCDFPEPHISLRAREFTLFPDDRIFVRHAVLEVMGVPVFYLPFWTKGLGAGSPWDVRFGYSSLLGAFVSIDYNYRHRLFEPDPFTGEMRMRTSGHLRAGFDYYTKRGLGYGAEYGYSFDDGTHRGRWQAYFIEDNDRDDDNRWLLHGNHRWQIDDDLVALLGADLVNDPEMYEDFFNDFDLSRGRVAQRRVFGALTLTQDDFISRLSADWRERLSEDRITNFSEPNDDNNDFDFDADGDGEDDLDERFDDERYGRVSERLEYTYATNQIQVGNLPVFYSWDVTAFSNLDAGLNRLRSFDDARVSGIDFYQSVLWHIQLTERLSLLVRGGLGLAAASRSDDDFDLNGPFPRRINNVVFAGDDTWYVGTGMVGNDGLNDFALDGTEGAFSSDTLSLDDADTFWLYGDAMARLQARLSDALTAYAEWRLRESSGQSLGELYSEAGMRTAQEDLYAFRLDEHWAEVGVRHRLRRPDLVSSLSYGRNLQSSGDIWDGETIQRLRGSTQWRNRARTFTIGVHGTLSETQLRHPSDSREVQIVSLGLGLTGSITPRHRIWYDTFGITAFIPLEDDKYRAFSDNDDDQLDENDTVISISNTIGIKISPLWDLTWGVRVTDSGDGGGGNNDDDGLQGSTSITLERDLHDAVLIIGLSADRDTYRGDDSSGDDRYDATVAVRFRGSHEEPVGVARPVLVVPRHRPGEIDDGV